MSKEKIIAAIHRHQTFLLTSHINPDGDAIGSELAMGDALRQMGKQVMICNQDEVPADYGFLPGVEQIKPVPGGPCKSREQGAKTHFEVLIVLDCGHIDRVGEFSPTDFKLVINIDHHATNQAFGDLDWFRHQAACTGELIFELICALPVKITPEIATCIYTALLTDTGSFHYTNTTAESFELAARLVEYGAQPEAISKAVYERMSLARMRLLGETLKTLELYQEGAIASVVVSRQMLETCGAVAADTEDLVNYPRAIDGVKIALFLRELEPNFYKGSLRSKVAVDVARVAEKFNGGGHFHAAGLRVRGSLEEVKQEIIHELSLALNELSSKETK